MIVEVNAEEIAEKGECRLDQVIQELNWIKVPLDAQGIKLVITGSSNGNY